MKTSTGKVQLTAFKCKPWRSQINGLLDQKKVNWKWWRQLRCGGLGTWDLEPTAWALILPLLSSTWGLLCELPASQASASFSMQREIKESVGSARIYTWQEQRPLFFSPKYYKCPQQFLTQSRCSVGICWISRRSENMNIFL